MRILSILPYPILPLTHGSRVRAYRLAVGLARAGATVDLCCPWHPQLRLWPFESQGVTIRPYIFAANVLPAILGDRVVPPQLQLSWQPFTSGPRHLLQQCPLYDIVEFHLCAFSKWMSRAARVTRVVYSAHNVELDYALSQHSSGLRRLLGRRIGNLERRAVHASDLVVTCTEADGKRLAELYGESKRRAVVSNGFDENDIGSGEPRQRERLRAELGLQPDELAILFVGGRAAHNRRAVRFLEDVLMPRLGRPARLVLVGECAEPRRQGRVIALGFVNALSPLLTAADIAVNPIASGSGSNVKVAEYVAAGLPVVTTPVGVRGYEGIAHLVTVVELDGFAAAIQASYRPLERGPALAGLSWSALGRRLYDIYADLLVQEPRS